MVSGGDQAKLKKQREALAKAIFESQTKPSVFAKTFLGETIFDYNVKYVDCPERLLIYRAGRKVGKSKSTSIKALHAALYAWQIQPIAAKEGVCDILIIAPTQAQASIIFDTIKTHAHKNKIIEKLIIRETAMQMELFWFNMKGKSRIFTRATGERGDSLRGYRPHILIADEAAFIKKEIFRAVIGGGLATRCHMWLVSTPFGRQGYFYEKSNSARPHKKDGKWIEFHAKSIDNPLIKDDPDFFDEVKNMTADESIQELEGNFVDFADALIPQTLITDAINGWHEPPEGARMFISVDVARAGKDETVYTIGSYDNNGVLYVIDAISEAQSNLVNVVQKIRDLMALYHGKIETVFIDETAIGSGVVDLAKSYDLPVRGIVFSKKTKTDMYHTMRLLFEEKKILIKSINKLAYQLSYLRRQYLDGGTYMKITSEEHDDYCDSLALMCNVASGMDDWTIYKNDAKVFG